MADEPSQVAQQILVRVRSQSHTVDYRMLLAVAASYVEAATVLALEQGKGPEVEELLVNAELGLSMLAVFLKTKEPKNNAH